VDHLTVRVPGELGLDLGCGQGYLALRALSHMARCIATDINPRALAFARANATLNGAGDRIDFREGSFFEPLRGVEGRLDLLTCNPPFVILPGDHVTAVSAPMEGDAMLEHLARHTPAMLRDGGWATFIGLWEHADPGEWRPRVRGWFEGCGCDALVLHFSTYTPEQYLTQWFPPDLRAGAERGWRALCERRRIGAVSYGGIVLRKRPGANWIRMLSTQINHRSGAASDQIRGLFATQTALATLSRPGDLLERTFRRAPGWRFDPARPMPRSAPGGLSMGLALPLRDAAQWEPVLAAFTGHESAGQVLGQMRQSGTPGLPPDDAGAAEWLRGLASQGHLEVVA
jgi:SAM-dependent methyltransferase